MDDQQVDISARWALVTIGRSDKLGGIEQTVGINAHDKID
jgi:hypothetical protein